jgi:D-arginine dehydrogenase
MAKVLPLGLQPMRRSAVMMAVPSRMDCMAWPLFGTVSEQWYAKPTGGKLMISPADEDPIDAQDAYPDDMTLAEGLWRFEQATTVPMSRPSNAWAGLRTFLPDRTPAVGFDPSADGFFWLVGQGGYGVQTCPAMAELAASIILGQTPHLASDVVSALSPKRFR